MASTSEVQQSFQQQFKCKECGLALNSAESLDVHRQYHEGNLMQQWAGKVHSGSGEEKNNNMTKQPSGIKREFQSNNSIPTDSSEVQKKSPEYQQRHTPEAVYGHPPTPQSFQSGSSPYQNNDNSTFSPNFQNYSLPKSERNSPASQQNLYPNYSTNIPDHLQFFNIDNPNTYPQDVHANKMINASNFRYNPYQQQRPPYYGPPKSVVSTPAASPAYPPQPTPSPSPKQCEKCGCIYDTPALLIEHMNLRHPGEIIPSQYIQSNHFIFDPNHQQQTNIKEEDVSQSEILDLDSHKVVHPDWINDKDIDKRSNSDLISHSVSTMVDPSWPSQQQGPMFQSNHNMYLGESADQKLFSALPSMPESKLFQTQQKIFPTHSIDNQNFINGVSSSNSDINQQPYRAFEHLSPVSNSGISSSQPPPVNVSNPPTGPPSTKSANWKSNEARRPKTYNCTACNKWFTSSGHLKRHYNTTLHKNAVKSSGQPDPASMPISAHHHPAREATTSKDERSNSNSPREDSRDDSNGLGSQYDNRLGPMPGLLQHPPNGPYDRQGMQHNPPMPSPLGQHHATLSNPTPHGGHMMQNPGFSSLANGSSPNGDAGLSPPDSRGLLAMSPASHNFNMMPQHHMMPMEATQFQMYPNGSAPHVTQATDITNLNTTGEQQIQFVVQTDDQPLPSFAQIQAHRFIGGYADVGGLESVTAPTSYTAFFTTDGFDLNDATRELILKEEENDTTYTVFNTDSGLITTQQTVDEMCQFSPTNSNNNNDVTFEQMADSSGIAYVSSGSSQPLTSPLSQSNAPAENQNLTEPLSISSEEQSESKENYEGDAAGSPSISSTVSNQEDLSKTKCFDCDKVFNRPCYLTQHNKTCHDGDKPYKCSRCGKRFSDEDTYKEHTRKHAGDKPHKCDMCPKMFNHKTDLRRHLCCHTGRKPYACETCGKGFIRKDHMVKHMDTHQRKKEKLSAMRN